MQGTRGVIFLTHRQYFNIYYTDQKTETHLSMITQLLSGRATIQTQGCLITMDALSLFHKTTKALCMNK